MVMVVFWASRIIAILPEYLGFQRLLDNALYTLEVNVYVFLKPLSQHSTVYLWFPKGNHVIDNPSHQLF